MYYLDIPDEHGRLWRYTLSTSQFVDMQRQIHEAHIQAMQDSGVEIADIDVSFEPVSSLAR